MTTVAQRRRIVRLTLIVLGIVGLTALAAGLLLTGR
jgi:hypothetical protein